MKRLEVFLLPLDGMLVHRRSLPRNFARFLQQFAGTHLYTWVERGTVRVKCLAQEHNTMSLARARTRTANSRVEHTNHEATAPPTKNSEKCLIYLSSIASQFLKLFPLDSFRFIFLLCDSENDLSEVAAFKSLDHNGSKFCLVNIC